MLPLIDPPGFNGSTMQLYHRCMPLLTEPRMSRLWRFCSSDLWIYGYNRLASGLSDLSAQC